MYNELNFDLNKFPLNNVLLPSIVIEADYLTGYRWNLVA